MASKWIVKRGEKLVAVEADECDCEETHIKGLRFLLDGKVVACFWLWDSFWRETEVSCDEQ